MACSGSASAANRKSIHESHGGTKLNPGRVVRTPAASNTPTAASRPAGQGAAHGRKPLPPSEPTGRCDRSRCASLARLDRKNSRMLWLGCRRSWCSRSRNSSRRRQPGGGRFSGRWLGAQSRRCRGCRRVAAGAAADRTDRTAKGKWKTALIVRRRRWQAKARSGASKWPRAAVNVARHDSRNWAKMPTRSAMACASSTASQLYNDFWGANSQWPLPLRPESCLLGLGDVQRGCRLFAVELGQRGLL